MKKIKNIDKNYVLMKNNKIIAYFLIFILFFVKKQKIKYNVFFCKNHIFLSLSLAIAISLILLFLSYFNSLLIDFGLDS